ncbi:serine/threonine-protein kinase [Streptosporangium sp. NPDC001681]|uniref:serine/threonine-protein kinase n=1 Tax=Streptosporangium sp. NPDC001681 TaxID=3154395 RepID=UPI00331A202C
MDPERDVDSRDVEHAGSFRLLGRLGAGGMGTVYVGEDTDGRRAAVKLIHVPLSEDPEFRARFAREIAVLSRVGGTCTAKVLAADPAADRPWLATEYVPGPTLGQRVGEAAPLTGDDLYGLAAGLAEALVAMYQAGVVHRDLKPSNVILSPSGPKVVDFGIAKLLDQTAITQTGHIVGSPGWVSPEEYRGDFAGLPADVYGWALLVAYAASGRPPYGVGRPEVLALRVLNDSPDLSAVPEELRDLVARALSKDPAARPVPDEVLNSIARLWCERHGAPYEVATVVVTRMLASTWSVPVPEDPHSLSEGVPLTRGEEPAALPQSHGVRITTGQTRQASTAEKDAEQPRRKRSRGWLVGLVALGAAAATVVVFLPQLNPFRETDIEIANHAAAQIAEAPAIRFRNGAENLTITGRHFGLGETRIHGQKVELLALPSDDSRPSGEWTFFRAPAKFWSIYANSNKKFLEEFADSEEALSGIDERLGAETNSFFLKDFVGEWSYMYWGNQTLPPGNHEPWITNKSSPVEIAEFLKIEENRPLAANTKVSRTSLRGVSAVKVAQDRMAVYVTEKEPHTLLRVEVLGEFWRESSASDPVLEAQWFGYDATELSESEADALNLQLSQEVSKLHDALDYDRDSPDLKITFGSCGAKGCTVRVRDDSSSGVRTPSDGSKMVVTVKWEARRSADLPGKTIDTCRRRSTLPSPLPQSRTSWCRITSDAWRSWWSNPAGRQAYPLVRVFYGGLSKAQVQELVASLR